MKQMVSVVMPVFNQENFLAETIESVLKQSYSNFEFLILDDGSTDRSAQVIKKYSELDSRIFDLYDKNTGKAKATNRLAHLAKGEFLVFLDADDVMLPHRIEHQLKFHELNPEVDGTSCHCYYIDSNGKEMGKQRYPFLKTVAQSREVVKNNQIIHCAFTGLMVKRSNFLCSGGLRQDFWPAEDFDFANRFIEKGNVLVIIQELLMKYRIHPNSITYRNQSYMTDKGGYVGECVNLRRNGKDEITFEDYLKLKKKKSLLKKSKTRMLQYSQLYHKKAGFCLYQKNYPGFVLQIFLAVVFSPRYVYSSLKNRISFNYLKLS